ncbi:hypothetical protein [Noviherbaspirillum saxi]|uniref:hypothetical protein n=1 Tax=Noviherbaspirillum saxi TaxID=2320863 RepID=UPI001314163F|nr:hypothetical protein [Noviherbaspirillum saxi]
MEQSEYRLMQLVGGVVLCGGFGALAADATLAAMISLIVGVLILSAGVIGSWLDKS